MANINGVVVGTVSGLDDPRNEGRIQVDLPWAPGRSRSFWAPVASIMAGPKRGAWFLPELGDEALVAFDHTDVDTPYILGFLWNGQDLPPSEHIRDRMIYSKNGHTIRFVDATPENGNMGALILEDGHGNVIALSNGQIHLKSIAVLQIEAPSIVLRGPGYVRVVQPTSHPI